MPTKRFWPPGIYIHWPISLQSVRRARGLRGVASFPLARYALLEMRARPYRMVSHRDRTICHTAHILVIRDEGRQTPKDSPTHSVLFFFLAFSPGHRSPPRPGGVCRASCKQTSKQLHSQTLCDSVLGSGLLNLRSQTHIPFPIYTVPYSERSLTSAKLVSVSLDTNSHLYCMLASLTLAMPTTASPASLVPTAKAPPRGWA